MKWRELETIPDEINAELKDYHPLVRKLLYTRGIRDEKSAKRFLNPKLSHLEDPFSFYDIEKACKRIEKAINDGERIFIHGDFDVDGICATAILWDYLYRQRNARVLPYIPSRVDEGYGMSKSSIGSIKKKGGDLVISVDCGIRDSELIASHRKTKNNPDGLDFIVTDHHELGEKLPRYIPVIHPLHPKGDNQSKYISGAAVAWKLVAALEKRRSSDFKWEKIPGLDLVGMATVCDIMPLVGENRIFVAFGLEQMRRNPRLGIRAMMGESSILRQDLEAYHLGFILGPRINAAGRIGDATDALRLLVTQKSRRAESLAEKLGKLNRERQEMTKTLLDEARAAIEEEGTGKHLYFAYGDDWPEGIIGLVAGKIQEEFNHPVVVVSKKKSESRGSARSVSGFSIIEAIESLGDLLESFGGHDQAAGFTVKTQNIEDFKQRLQSIARKQLKESHFIKEVKADAVVEVSDLDWEFWNASQSLAPFGYGNRKPVFWIKNAMVAGLDTVGDGKHLKLILKGEEGDFLSCIYFRGGNWINRLAEGDTIDLVGNLNVNKWNGEENLQFRVIDLRLV
jgi:single-stranded-DNA-specific exonuclease